MNFSIAPS